MRAVEVHRLSAIVGVIACALAAAACGGEQCLAYGYAPPSARLQVVDAVSGELLCDGGEYSVSTDRGEAIAHEETCEWWLPAWTASTDAGAQAEVVITVSGYRPQTVSIPVTRNRCGEIQQPALRVDVEPEPG